MFIAQLFWGTLVVSVKKLRNIWSIIKRKYSDFKLFYYLVHLMSWSGYPALSYVYWAVKYDGMASSVKPIFIYKLFWYVLSVRLIRHIMSKLYLSRVRMHSFTHRQSDIKCNTSNQWCILFINIKISTQQHWICVVY